MSWCSRWTHSPPNLAGSYWVLKRNRWHGMRPQPRNSSVTSDEVADATYTFTWLEHSDSTEGDTNAILINHLRIWARYRPEVPTLRFPHLEYNVGLARDADTPAAGWHKVIAPKVAPHIMGVLRHVADGTGNLVFNHTHAGTSNEVATPIHVNTRRKSIWQSPMTRQH